MHTQYNKYDNTSHLIACVCLIQRLKKFSLCTYSKTCFILLCFWPGIGCLDHFFYALCCIHIHQHMVIDHWIQIRSLKWRCTEGIQDHIRGLLLAILEAKEFHATNSDVQTTLKTKEVVGNIPNSQEKKSKMSLIPHKQFACHVYSTKQEIPASFISQRPHLKFLQASQTNLTAVPTFVFIVQRLAVVFCIFTFKASVLG